MVKIKRSIKSSSNHRTKSSSNCSAKSSFDRSAQSKTNYKPKPKSIKFNGSRIGGQGQDSTPEDKFYKDKFYNASDEKDNKTNGDVAEFKNTKPKPNVAESKSKKKDFKNDDDDDINFYDAKERESFDEKIDNAIDNAKRKICINSRLGTNNNFSRCEIIDSECVPMRNIVKKSLNDIKNKLTDKQHEQITTALEKYIDKSEKYIDDNTKNGNELKMTNLTKDLDETFKNISTEINSNQKKQISINTFRIIKDLFENIFEIYTHQLDTFCGIDASEIKNHNIIQTLLTNNHANKKIINEKLDKKLKHIDCKNANPCMSDENSCTLSIMRKCTVNPNELKKYKHYHKNKNNKPNNGVCTNTPYNHLHTYRNKKYCAEDIPDIKNLQVMEILRMVMTLIPLVKMAPLPPDMKSNINILELISIGGYYYLKFIEDMSKSLYSMSTENTKSMFKGIFFGIIFIGINKGIQTLCLSNLESFMDYHNVSEMKLFGINKFVFYKSEVTLMLHAQLKRTCETVYKNIINSTPIPYKNLEIHFKSFDSANKGSQEEYLFRKLLPTYFDMLKPKISELVQQFLGTVNEKEENKKDNNYFNICYTILTIIFCSICFALFHVINLTHSRPPAVICQIVMTFIMGIYLHIITLFNEDFRVPILTHFFHNYAVTKSNENSLYQIKSLYFNYEKNNHEFFT